MPPSRLWLAISTVWLSHISVPLDTPLPRRVEVHERPLAVAFLQTCVITQLVVFGYQ